MKILHSWLLQHIHTHESPEKIGEILTDIGLEVETIDKLEAVKGGLEGVVVGHVLTCVQHPNADKLTLTTVDVGAGEPLQIVCGAPNVAAGQKVPVALVGTTLYPSTGEPIKLKAGKIRGEVSQGMICAEDELGLGSSHDGILVLAEDARVGMPAAEYFDLKTDFVYEIGLTPNRTDAMCHYGVARDLHAALVARGFQSALKKEMYAIATSNQTHTIPVYVENTVACPQYFGLTISGVKVAPSPEWLQKALRGIGVKTINNVVDITNYVLHEYGHPLHAFDAAAITGGKVVVKNALEGTKFITLDGSERTLSGDDLMIYNAESPMCIAGVFGGITSGVTEKTTDIFLESAWFNPVSIRKTAKRHMLSTDASYRYERGVDPSISTFVMARAAQLICDIAGGAISSDLQSAVAQAQKPRTIKLNLRRLNILVGNEIDAEEVEKILTLLEFEIVEKSGNDLLLKVPTYRVDVTREADVVEEFLRIYGFNRVELPGHMRISISADKFFNDETLARTAIAFLASNGFFETMSNSLTKVGYYEKWFPESANSIVHMLNPLSQDLGVLRQNLYFGGLEVLNRNINRQRHDVKIFELGKTYFNNGSGSYTESTQLMLMSTGKTKPESWASKSESTTFFHLSGVVGALLSRLGVDVRTTEQTLHPVFGEGISYRAANKTVAFVYRMNDAVAKYFDVEQEVFAAQIEWETMVEIALRHKTKFRELMKFPAVRRDLALLVNHEITYETMRQSAAKAGGKLLKNINLFDVYTGKNLPEGKKSYAMSFVLQDENETLTDERVEQVMDKILKSLSHQFDAQLR